MITVEIRLISVIFAHWTCVGGCSGGGETLHQGFLEVCGVTISNVFLIKSHNGSINRASLCNPHSLPQGAPLSMWFQWGLNPGP